jgi:hypothetical protein
MATREDARALAQRIHALGGGEEVRRKAAARALSALHPTEATELLQYLLELKRDGWEPARCVLASVVSALFEEASEIPHVRSLRRLAEVQELALVEDLFADGPPAQQVDEDSAARSDAKLFTESLGHLKSKARLTRDPNEMLRLAGISNPAVVRQLLLNPRLTESVVLRIAARRPARPEPLMEIWRCAKWFARHAVKRALVLNPYLPPEVGSKIVPLLTAADWRELARDPGLHAAIRDQARLLASGAPEGAGTPSTPSGGRR